MTDFVHLHVHSHYSLLNGLTKVKKLVKAAKERGFSALALTDYGSLYGAIEFYQACLDQGIKPIIGFEAFVAPRSRFDKDTAEDETPFNLILLAENYTGYRNLLKLSSYGHLEGFHNGKPRVDKELLRTYHEGVIALSGGMDGEIPRLIRADRYLDAKAKAVEYQEIFGADYFFLELEDHPAISGQVHVNTKLIEMAKETGIPLVATRDVHYLKPDEAEAADILRCIAEGWKVDQGGREDFRAVDRSLNSGDDIASRFRHVPEAIANTVKIAARVNIEIALNVWHFAPVDLPPGKTADEALAEEAHARVSLYYPEVTSTLTERLNYELDIIKTKGYSPYFICVADFVRYAKANGIVESTRGSAAGSLVSYVLGITTVDPMRFNLPFERFLNPFRPSPPDIDTDFADDRRDDMIKYVTEKYGADKVAQIITFGTMAARASVRDVGRALGLSYSFCDQVAKLIPPGAQGFPMTIERALKEEPDLKKLYETNVDVKRLLDLAQKVEGCARHTSIHAAGVVIAPTALIDFSPVQYEVGGTRLTTQYEMKSVETAGVLKNDFLGIRNLAILGNAVQFVKKTTGVEVDIYNLPLDDKKIFEMLARGETMGVFQLGGSGMTRWLKELKPNRIEDIMAMVALYRPGPMESIPEYIRRKYHPEEVKFLDPRLEKILGASYGLLVYQDDVMLTAIELAGYDWMDADKFRKAMGKKIPEEMAKQKLQFYDGCQRIGKVKKEVVDELWRAIEPFAAYGFNKCVVGETEIIDAATGAIKTIKEIYEHKLRLSVLSLGKDKKFTTRKITDIYKNGKKPVWEITTRSGRKITATGNHPFLKFEGWTNLENLVVGDLIAVASAARGKDIIPAQILHLVREEMARQGITLQKISKDIKIATRLFHEDSKRKGYLRETIEKIGYYLQSDEILNMARSDIYWDEVVAIKSQGVQETYDLTVPGEHNFVANDFVVHNSHAASYGIVAYQTAYMKAHYPVQFMTAILQAEASDLEKVAAIVHECKRMGIEVLPPDINESFKNFAMVSKPGEPGRIRFGLNAIKNVGEHICGEMYRERKEHGAYASLEDFLKRVQDKDLNKKSLESLTEAGALDCFGFDRGLLLANSEHILLFAREHREHDTSKQNSLFAGTAIALDTKVTLKPAPPATMTDKLTWEKELLGLYLSSHPLDPFMSALRSVTTPIAEVEFAPRDSWVTIAGVVEAAKKKITKKGDVMLFVTLQDMSGPIELLVFPKTYERTKDLWVDGALVAVVGKTPREEGDNKVFAENAYALHRDTLADLARQLTFSQTKPAAAAAPEKYIRLTLTQDELKTHSDALKQIFAAHPGEYVVYVQVGTGTIRAGAKISWNESVTAALADIIDAAKIEVSP